MKKQFIVIGLGRFGISICKELYKIGHEVLAVDLIPEHVDAVKDFVTYSAIADATNEASLQELGANNFDHAVVAIGENLQASVLVTLMLKEIGVPIVWTKARNLQHQRVLEKVGADLVIQPEFDMGVRVAHHMDSEKIIDYIDLSEDYSIIEWEASPKTTNKTLKELNITAKYRCMILAIKRGENVNIAPMLDYEVQKGDVLVVIGHRDGLKKFERKLL